VEPELRDLRRVASSWEPSPPSPLFREASRMRYQLALSAALAICLTALTTARTSAQSAPEWRVGTGFLISRPNDARLWGVNAQREQSVTRLIVYRGAASVDFLGLDFDPTLITLGADVGVRLRLAPLSAMVAVGPSVAFFAATLMLAAGSAAVSQRGSRTLTGTVVDSTNHKPISQAAIYAGRWTAGRTGTDGTFRVTADQDPTMLIARRPGYIPTLVPVPPDSTTTEKDLGTLSLRPVKTDADRAAVQDADTKMFPELAEFYAHKTQFRQGVFLSPDDLQRVGGNLFTWIRQKQGCHCFCLVALRGYVDCGQE